MSEYIACPYCHNPLSQSEYVKVVRCRDCVKWHEFDYEDGRRYGECDEWKRPDSYCTPATAEDGFCAWGERRDRETIEVWNQWSADDVTCSEESKSRNNTKNGKVLP